VIYSTRCEYAILALSYMARHQNQLVQVKSICQERDIPYAFLAKIMQVLVRADIVRSLQGRNGGFLLMRPAEQIYLVELKTLFDGVSGFTRCALGKKRCSTKRPCFHHKIWSNIQTQVLNFLKTTTLADLAAADMELLREQSEPMKMEV